MEGDHDGNPLTQTTILSLTSLEVTWRGFS